MVSEKPQSDSFNTLAVHSAPSRLGHRGSPLRTQCTTCGRNTRLAAFVKLRVRLKNGPSGFIVDLLDFSVKENTHTKGAFYDVFEPVFAKQGRRALWETYRN